MVRVTIWLSPEERGWRRAGWSERRRSLGPESPQTHSEPSLARGLLGQQRWLCSSHTRTHACPFLLGPPQGMQSAGSTAEGPGRELPIKPRRSHGQEDIPIEFSCHTAAVFLPHWSWGDSAHERRQDFQVLPLPQAAWTLSPLPRLRKPTRKKPRAGGLSCMRRHGALEPETFLPASSSVREPPEGRVLSFTSQPLRTPFLLQVRKQRPNQPNKTMGPSVGPPRAWPSLLFLSSSLGAQHAPLAAEPHLTYATARGGLKSPSSLNADSSSLGRLLSLSARGSLASHCARSCPTRRAAGADVPGLCAWVRVAGWTQRTGRLRYNECLGLGSGHPLPSANQEHLNLAWEPHFEMKK